MVLLYLLNLFLSEKLCNQHTKSHFVVKSEPCNVYIHIQVTQFKCQLNFCIILCIFFYERYIMIVKKDKDTSSSISSTSSPIFPSSILAQVSRKSIIALFTVLIRFFTLWCKSNIVQYPWLTCMTEQEIFYVDQYRPTIVGNRFALNGLCKRGYREGPFLVTFLL